MLRTVRKAKQGKTAQNREAFWAYCRRASAGANHRSRQRGLPCDIDPYAIDELLVSQQWRCAVSGIDLSPPAVASKSGRDPFGPSLDRIIPPLGYVRGNLRIVSNMVNYAINEWGEAAFMRMVDAIVSKRSD